ncbi:cupin domain-containing protein [Aureibacter tunicatorum]|uniref:DUF985 domain-containing protein n=1 Tax=Aureibacter tunicatorum TaxID=866807 RepID=A0AAE3XJU0_9BACT|nr:cupin domain-containing protein [Aureibacter tunicatorum]MDR6237712.1 hypothetical protein [Aureibacter tunicatorum]BDD02747.1 cupin [Aureibacter tunicatorum]
MKQFSANYWINSLNLSSHPEGGHYKETYASSIILDKNSTNQNFSGDRKLATSIYFLLEKNEKSHLHRLKSDEIWYHHYGDSLTIHILENGEAKTEILGPDIENGQKMQVIVPAGAIFGSECREGEFGYGLVGCMVAPGFDFEDFELFKASELASEYPNHHELLKKMCLS